MANSKPTGKDTVSYNMRIRFRIARGERNSPITSLSEVEDGKDPSFWHKVTRDAAAKAINENLALNIPITVLEDGWVVQKYKDGTIVKVKEIENEGKEIFSGLTKGSILHIKKTMGF
ncbi:hypothetical protein [Paraflavitalea pollutisoli]|uniref:hypothetical protein n=1 Tax=Paraflavitalea pollutisoli TaxID=3034143 RepID=UPI0023EAE33E|nr:hypothetical protein [Paraflavitalea sp. H1-2-19X]